MGLENIKEYEGFLSKEVILFPAQNWSYKEDTLELNEINATQIISYNQSDSSVCSRYGDDEWHLTHSLNPKQHKFIFFSKITYNADRELAKRLIFTIIHFSKGKGGIKTPSSIIPFYEKVILPMQQYASEKNVTLSSFFENSRLMMHYITSIVKEKNSRAMPHITLLTLLKRIPENITGIHYYTNHKHIEVLSQYSREYNHKHNQTECIPPRILQNAQQMRWEHIDAVSKVLPQLVQFLERLMREPFNYHTIRGNASKKAKKAGIPLPERLIHPKELIKELLLVEFCKKYGIEHRNSLMLYLVKLSRTSRHLIYGYTGMRNDEGSMLELGCYQEKGAGAHPVIIGLEKKNGIPKIHPFVTIKEIKKVINVQTAITTTIAKYSHPDEKYLPLLFNPRWIMGGVKHMEADTKEVNNELSLDQSRLILTEEEMINTLKATEQRDWDNDKDFQVGKVWKFKWHQYRRSIAVYALNSGLISLTALGKQYRHMFEATTAHYGNGHFVAEPLAGTDSKFHVKHEMDEQREQYEALAMYTDMMFNLDRPESGFAPENNNDEDISPEEQIMSPKSLDTLAKRIKNGEASYTNTAVGSCKSMNPCDGHIMLFFVGCADCKDIEVNDDKLAYTIQSVSNFKEELEIHMPGSVELRDIEFDIVALSKLQQKKTRRQK